MTAAQTAPGLMVERATWLPSRTERVGDWLLGFTDGLTRRANSAVPAIAGAGLTDLERTRIEERYAAAGQRPVFRVCAAAHPGLDRQLADHGYALCAGAQVLVRYGGSAGGHVTGPGSPPAAPPGLTMSEYDLPERAWLGTWLGGRAPMQTAVGLLGSCPARYLSARTGDGTAVGTIRVAFADDWAGLSCLVVDPLVRRQGIGRILTLEALRVADDYGARRVFLQVEVNNSPAFALYRSLGFMPAERYHYRERP